MITVREVHNLSFSRGRRRRWWWWWLFSLLASFPFIFLTSQLYYLHWLVASCRISDKVLIQLYLKIPGIWTLNPCTLKSCSLPLSYGSIPVEKVPKLCHSSILQLCTEVRTDASWNDSLLLSLLESTRTDGPCLCKSTSGAICKLDVCDSGHSPNL